MKFSRFICRISDSLFILPHPGNIVKRFFQLFSKYLFARLTHAVFTGCLRQLDYITTFSHSRQGGFSSFFDILLFLFLYMPERSSECTLHFSIYNVRKSSAYFFLPCFFTDSSDPICFFSSPYLLCYFNCIKSNQCMQILYRNTSKFYFLNFFFTIHHILLTKF